ncbi:MAG TPA: hypothetical protein VFM93_06415 [Candidatus Limnocylindria bacterium]|nr:hypothetical protein [Candidatus Limnocylindria bacterium]
MKRTSFATTVGSTGDPGRGADVILTHEPEIGATLRTKGRFYALCEVSPPADEGRDLAREVADEARQEYYYDLSAGIEVSLRKAIRNANRRAAQRLREMRRRPTIHIAVAVVVNNEVHATHVGAAEVFLVRHARLFLPGDAPGELADFVHRTTTREAASLGSEPDLLPAVWRQPIEAGDTLILASSALVYALGAETLKNAAVTLHPRAAAAHVHNRFVAEGHTGSDAVLFIEIAPSPGAAQRVAVAPPPVLTPPEVEVADKVRSRLGWFWRRRPRFGDAAKAVAAPAATAVGRGIAIGLELMPRARTALPRQPDVARQRARRRQRFTTALAFALLLVAAGIGAVVVRDYQANQVVADYRVLVQRIEDDIAGARRVLEQQRPDPDRARERVAAAKDKIARAERSPAADGTRLAAFRDELSLIEDRLANVAIDLARIAPGSRPTQLVGNVNGLYVADPGSGRLWRVFGDPLETGVVLERGQRNVGSPVAVVLEEAVVFAIDDARRVFRAEGNTIAQVTPPGNERWTAVTSVAMFFGNLYVLDAKSGQVWRHEGEPGGFGRSAPFLAQALAPDAARSLAVDGDIWVVTTAGEVLRFRRQGLSTSAERIAFTPRWEGTPVRPVQIQALESQRSIYFLDAAGRRVVRMARDGRETARFALPGELPEPSAFYVSEVSSLAYTLHGSKLVVTEMSR